MSFNYPSLKSLLANEPLPAMLVDLELFDDNVRHFCGVAAVHGKTVRVATKSIRVPELIQRVLEIGGERIKGLMCYSAPEARLLASLGMDHFLLAYPVVQPSDFAVVTEMQRQKKEIVLMVDAVVHLDAIADYARLHPGAFPQPVKVCIDADMSYRPRGAKVHLGVQRSPIRSLADFQGLVSEIGLRPQLELTGVMGYEAQIAGVPDRSPFARWMNPIVRLMKYLSTRDVHKRRRLMREYLQREKIPLSFFNGGGTGSLLETNRDPVVTEVTVGSGFLQSQLFDYYRQNRSQPAFCFGLRVTRVPQSGVVTCQSGGFIASGAASPDKAPRPYLPPGLSILATEGFGEVQTPLRHPASLTVVPGDPLFFRPAKAGEIAERFNEYLLLRNGKLEGRTKTYRGLGHSFF